MAPPIYFFPKVTKTQLVVNDKLNPEVLAPRKLATTFADVSVSQCYVEERPGAGPGDETGTFLVAFPPNGERGPRIGYYADHQDWTEFAEGEHRFWVGIDKDQPPGPDDLARKQPIEIDGYRMELAGNEWLIPVVRDLRGGTGLPVDWLLASDGSISEEVQAVYRELWTQFAAVVDIFLNPDDTEGIGVFGLAPTEAMKWCLKALAINYRVGRAEQNLLHLINSHNYFRVLGNVVDLQTCWDVYQAAIEAKQDRKKKENPDAAEPRDESPDTGPGGPDSPLGTDPVEPS